MRTLEIALLLVNVPLLAWFFVVRSLPAWSNWLRVLGLILLVAHLALDGQRWQMWPAYAVVAWLGLSLRWPGLAMPGPWTGLAGMALLVSAGAMSYVLPVFRLPAPGGPYPVGTETRQLVDSARRETHIPGDHPRELVVQFWYPAARSGPAQPYRSRHEVSFRHSRLALVATHSTANAELSPALPRYPVLIYFPSWTGQRDENTPLVEELASRGYIVVAVDHPYGCELTTFSDGRRVPTMLGAWLDFSSDESQERSQRQLDVELNVRMADARFVLDTLAGLDAHDPDNRFTGRLDLRSVGALGYSFGGAVAAELARDDARVRAAVDLDGCLFGDAATDGIPKPFLVVSDDLPGPTPAAIDSAEGSRRRRLEFLASDVNNVQRSLQLHGGYALNIRGTRHANFSIDALATPLRRRSGAGPIDALRVVQIVRDYTLVFFDQTLRGGPGALVAGPNPDYPEAVLQAWPVSRPADDGAALP